MVIRTSQFIFSIQFLHISLCISNAIKFHGQVLDSCFARNGRRLSIVCVIGRFWTLEGPENGHIF